MTRYGCRWRRPLGHAGIFRERSDVSSLSVLLFLINLLMKVVVVTARILFFLFCLKGCASD